MDSSIIADLKRFSGAINAIKITSVEPPAAVEVAQDPPVKTKRGRKPKNEVNANTDLNANTGLVAFDICANTSLSITDTPAAVPVLATPRKPGRAPKTLREVPAELPKEDVSIEKLVSQLGPNLQPVRDETGIVHDIATFAAKCNVGHIHKYFLKDLSPSLKCVSCSHGNKFQSLVRTTAEEYLKVPFIVVENSGNNSPEYTNPVVGITIRCIKAAGADFMENNVLNVHQTTSLKKIKDAIFLLANDGRLTDEQREKISTIHPPAVKKPARQKHRKEPLPYNPALAEIVTAGDENPVLARMHMNIVSGCDQLCLENC